MIVMRSARSPLLKEAGDLSSALTDAEGRLIAQGRDIPMHMGVMGFTVKELLERVPRGADARRRRVVPQPARGRRQSPAGREGGAAGLRRRAAGRLRDQPRALGGHRRRRSRQLRAVGHRVLPGRAAHRADPALLGGGPGAPDASTSILANLRGRDEREGDIFAQYAADDVAARRLAELFERYGAETIEACFERLHAESESADARGAPRAARRRLGRRGLARRRRCRRPAHPHPGAHREARATRRRSTSRGTDPQTRGPVNTTYFIACSSVYYAMKALVAPDVPPNEGCYRPLARHRAAAAPCSTAIPTGRWSAAITRPRSAWSTRS